MQPSIRSRMRSLDIYIYILDSRIRVLIHKKKTLGVELKKVYLEELQYALLHYAKGYQVFNQESPVGKY